jgi:hypothetical protein
VVAAANSGFLVAMLLGMTMLGLTEELFKLGEVLTLPVSVPSMLKSWQFGARKNRAAIIQDVDIAPEGGGISRQGDAWQRKSDRGLG